MNNKPRKPISSHSIRMKTKLFFIGSLLLGVLFLSAEQPAVDILKLDQGIDKSSKMRPLNIDINTDGEFLDFQRAFAKKGGNLIFTVPAEDAPEKYRYAGLGPIPIQPLHRYTLFVESSNTSTNFTGINAVTILKGDAPAYFVILDYTHNDFLACTAHEFQTPPEADRLVVWLGASAWPNQLAPGPKVEFKSLKIIDRGAVDGIANPGAASPKDNLLPVSDFESEALGAFTNRSCFYPGNGADAPKWKNVFAEIVVNDSKCLHITKGTNGYIYPHFKSRGVNLNNSTVLFTFRIKGKGQVSPGIWWQPKEKGADFSYYHEGFYYLTDTWQTVRAWRACTNDTDFAACDFYINSPEAGTEADFYVDDLSLTIIPPR